MCIKETYTKDILSIEVILFSKTILLGAIGDASVYKNVFKNCAFDSNEYAQMSASSVAECAVSCFTWGYEGLLQKGEECSLMKLCPKSCCPPNNGVGWDVFCLQSK